MTRAVLFSRARWALLEAAVVLTLTFLLVVLAATAGLPSRPTANGALAAEETPIQVTAHGDNL